MECATDSSDEEDDFHSEKHDDIGQCSSSALKKHMSLPEEAIDSLMNGSVQLPYSKQFSLPAAVPCPGECGEAYYCRSVGQLIKIPFYCFSIFLKKFFYLLVQL